MQKRTMPISTNLYIVFFISIFVFTNNALTNTSYAEDTTDNITEYHIETSEAVTVAPNLDLKEVAPLPKPVVTPAHKGLNEGQSDNKKDKETSSETIESENIDFDGLVAEDDDKLVILGAEVPASTSTRLTWSPQITISGLSLPTPVLIVKGKNPGPTLCITSAIHGDELNGIEVVRRVMYDIEPDDLNGTLIGVPIVNLQGFQSATRYLSDRRDLNRYFPGEPNGSLASRIANSFFHEIIIHCNYLIDIHTGSFRRTNLPQIRADMSNEEVAQFVESFDKIAIVHHAGSDGMLRKAANDSGIIAVTMELGESLRIQESQITAGTHSINRILDKLKMYPRMLIWGEPEPAYYESMWLRVESGGILFNEMNLGDSVSEGDVLGIVTDPITNHSTELISPIDGNIIGMAINQVVIPGFAAYHIGIESTQEEMASVDDDIEQIDTDGETIDPE